MKKAIGKRIIALMLALAFMITTSITVMFTSAQTYNTQAGVQLNKTMSDQEIEFDSELADNNYITMNYSVSFDAIAKSEIPVDTTDKEIVIVLDTSGSMDRDLNGGSDGTSRLSIVKTAAKNFLEDLNTISNVKVALVEYNSTADVYNDTSPLRDLSADFYNLVSKVNGYDANGYTNIGDGIRRANYILQNGSSSAEKFIVVLTDGEPTALSLDDISKTTTYYSSYAIGKYYYDGGSSSKYVSNVNSVNTLRTNGDPDKYVVFYGGDYKNYALEYAKEMASKLKVDISTISSSYIAFSNVDAQNKLQAISLESNGTYYTADSASEIDLVYAEIANEITAEVSLENMRFEELIPNNIEVIEASNGVSVVGNSLIKEIGTVNYTLNAAGTHYVAEPFEFTVKVAPSQAGTYLFGYNNTSALHYTDVDGFTKHKYFPAMTLTVNEMGDPNLRPDTVLDVLEVQPGRVFELSKSALEDRFAGLTVNLRQMSMTELVGNVEELNGRYDIIYVGAIESYANYDIYGLGDNKVTKNIDITNRKAADLIEFANTGQLVVVDNELFTMTGSKIKTNLDEIRSLNNVQEVNYITSSVLDSIVTWYGNSTHRPRLTGLELPKAYDGSKASYESDHLMSFLYTAFNEDSHVMDTYLSIDINGDGVFSQNEQVLKEDVNLNMSGLGLNYSLEDTFNGLMPWKLELVDSSTNAKDYITGFSAYSGDKTIVNVLQLSPGDNRMNIDSSSFVKPLNTEDYEINITYMQIKDFNEAYGNWNPALNEYPNAVSGNPTVLNGNYDMIIFGFGDSFAGSVDGLHSNKDLTEQSAIDAIDEFIQTGQSILFTHDTAGPQDYTNNFDMRTSTESYNDYVNYKDAPNMTANFKDDMGFSNTRTYAGMRMWRAWNTTKAFKLNEGLITMYPYVLADNAAKNLAIASTHDQYWEIDLEGENVVPWFTLDAGNFKYFPAAYYYTFTNGNITYSGTGHSTPNGVEEQEFFVNTMLKASRGANHAPTMDVVDLYDGMNIVPSVDEVSFNNTIHDVDLQDQLFKTEVYVVIDDLEILVKLMNNVPKDELVDIMFEKPPVLDQDVTEFVIKVIVEDEHGAQGVEEYTVTHKEVPTLNVTDNSAAGYLVGDTFNLTYEVSTVNPADKDVIKNIELVSSFDLTALNVTTWTDWSKSGDTFVMQPSFDDLATVGNESKTTYTLGLGAIRSGTSPIALTGSYDVVFSDGGDSLLGQSFEKETPIKVKVGIINVTVEDNLGRAVNGATISVTDSDGALIASGSTNSIGVFKATNLKTSVYTVDILSLPAEYEELSITTKEVTLNYQNATRLVEFTAKDNTAPIITTEYVSDMTITEGAEFILPIHVKSDGVKSKIVTTSMKKLGEGITEATASDFTGVNASTNVNLSAYNPSASEDVYKASPFTLDPLKEEGVEVLEYFTVTENGYYALYAINEAGNETVEVIFINNIIKVLPDSI